MGHKHRMIESFAEKRQLLKMDVLICHLTVSDCVQSRDQKGLLKNYSNLKGIFDAIKLYIMFYQEILLDAIIIY